MSPVWGEDPLVELKLAGILSGLLEKRLRLG